MKTDKKNKKKKTLREKLGTALWYVLLTVSFFGPIVWVINRGGDVGDGLLWGVLGVIMLIVVLLMPLALKDLIDTVSDPEKGAAERKRLEKEKRRKELEGYIKKSPCRGWNVYKATEESVKTHMLFVMQYGHAGGIEGALYEFNETFKCFPQWKLHEWEVFRAWYKHEIDHMVQRPEIYGLKMKSGKPYSPEADPLYDPEAPDWEQFDRDRTYDYLDDDEDDDDEDDYGDYDDRRKKKTFGQTMKDGFFFGVGFGIGNNLVGGDNGG